MSKSFTQFSYNPTPEATGYPGVLVIQVGPAKGHYAVQDKAGSMVNFNPSNPEHTSLPRFPIFVGEETLQDVVDCAGEGAIKCKLDHGSTAKDIIGHYTGFTIDGDKVRATLSLLDSTPHKSYVEELINKLSTSIGNSIDFDYKYDLKDGKAIARCRKLNSVDLVDNPAATNSLFNENPVITMALTVDDLNAITQAFQGVVNSIMSQYANTKAEDDKKEEEKSEALLSAIKDLSSKFDNQDNLKKAVFAAIHEANPKVTVGNLSTGAKPANDPYQEQFEACRKAGIPESKIALFIAKKHPELHNAKFAHLVENNTKL